MRRFFGTRSFYKELLIVTMPIAIQQFISSFVNILDMIMINQYYGSATATSAIAIASRYYNSFNMLMLSFAVGIAIYIAQFHGAKNKERLKQVFGISLIFCISVSIVAFLFGFFATDSILNFFLGMSNDPERDLLFYYGRTYLRIISIAFLMHGITNALVFAFRPVKMTRIPLYSAIGATIANALFNFLLIYGIWFFPELGIKGAAIATIITRSVELTIVLGYYLIKKPPFHGSFKEIFIMPWHLVKEVISKCKTLFFSQMLTESVFIFMLFVFFRVDRGGTSTGVAGIMISQQITDLVMVFVAGMGTAASVLIGSRLGENKIQEARDNARYQIGYVTIFGILAFFFMISLIPFVPILFQFAPEDTYLVRMIIILQAFALPFSIFSMNVIFILRSGGYTKAAVYINNLIYIGFKVPIIALLLFFLNTRFAMFGTLEVINNNLNLFQRYLHFTGSRIQSSGFIRWLDNISGGAGFIVFVFMVDRSLEMLRFLISVSLYRNAKWYHNLAMTL